MGQLLLNLFRVFVSVALEQAAAQSPFVYDLLPRVGNVVHSPSAWNLVSSGPTVWDWNLQGTNGTSWKWEVSEGIWTTWFWRQGEFPNSHGGGFRLRQLDDGDVWGELSWVQSAPREVKWLCHIRAPRPSKGETLYSVLDVDVDTWSIRDSGHQWGIVRRGEDRWAFCADGVCINLDYETCNRTVSRRTVEEVETLEPGFNNVDDVRPRVRRSPDNWFTDVIDSIYNFFANLFSSDDTGRDDGDGMFRRVLTAIVKAFVNTDDDSGGTGGSAGTIIANKEPVKDTSEVEDLA